VPPNNLLNYGYAILRAVVARALVSSGMLPTLGIHHHNRYNAYCLADDIMEPFRTIVDEVVYKINPSNNIVAELSQDMRRIIISALQEKMDTSNGSWKISDLILRSAQQIAESFQTEKNLLVYNLK
jgi:CRISPR-associated endonuclease Cas1 subtype II